ncbi:hypothetical protein LSUE1_G008664 [Lachnellula suecica]|uniref:RapZ C-terminal domain-containing protein n=1 Tax=Lachnellula suecica TaxID=602035 RepID=A0A8T9BXW8_9HELO|nr:hypothetical protein LSUE1_G008664 [Lachnellula suecica]
MCNYEEESPLPEYAQNILPEQRRPVLLLISHRHSPPLNLAPHLKVDVRGLPNPPKHIRDAHSGTSRRLQRWLNGDSQFIAKRDAIKLLLDNHKNKSVLRPEASTDRGLDPDSEQRPRSGDKIEAGDVTSGQEGATSYSNHETLDRPFSEEPELRISIFCAMGRHRSVAMAEELSKMSWAGWGVRFEHRDISKKRAAGREGGGKQGRGMRGGTSTVNNDSE